MSVVIRDGQQVEVPHRRLAVAMQIIAECKAEHGLEEIETDEPSVMRLQHGRGPTFTMSAALYETPEGVWNLEEWLRPLHGHDVLDVSRRERA